MRCDAVGYAIARARPGNHDEFHFARDLPPAVPRFDFRKGVRADEKCQRAGPAVFKLLDGMDGKAAGRTLLDAGNLEARLAGAGEFKHSDAVFERSVRSFLVRRIGGGNEKIRAGANRAAAARAISR